MGYHLWLLSIGIYIYIYMYEEINDGNSLVLMKALGLNDAERVKVH